MTRPIASESSWTFRMVWTLFEAKDGGYDVARVLNGRDLPTRQFYTKEGAQTFIRKDQQLFEVMHQRTKNALLGQLKQAPHVES